VAGRRLRDIGDCYWTNETSSDGRFWPNSFSKNQLINIFIRHAVSRSRKWLGCLCLLALAENAVALDPSRSVYQFTCRSWTRQNGLPANGVNAVIQSRDGYLWLGTTMGLVRFDGSEFKLFDMTGVTNAPSALVASLANSPRGGIWFGLGHGAFGIYEHDHISFRGKEEWGGFNLNVHTVLESAAGDVWIGAETQLARITRDGTYQAMMTGAVASNRYDVIALYADSIGRVWIGTSRRGLFYWQDGKITKFPDATLDNSIIRSIVRDSKGQLWLGTQAGIIGYDSNFKRLEMPAMSIETPVLLLDSRGVLWGGTSGGGVVRYSGGSFTSLKRTNGLADDFVTALAEDTEGNLWIGTPNGLSQLSDVKIPTFGKTEGFIADVNVAVAASRKGGLWVASSEGCMYYDGGVGGVQAFNMGNAGIGNQYIKCLVESKNGDVYLATGAMDVEVLSGGRVVAKYPNQAWPMAIVESAQGIVVGVGGELFRASTNRYEAYTFANGQKPPLGWIFNLAADPDGSFWVACDNGICQVKGETFTMWTKENGLPNSKAMWVCRDDDGIIWAGFESGIARIKGGKVRSMTREDGLFDNVIYAIVPDDFGSLWVDSSRGIYRVTRQSLNDFADGKADRIQCVPYDGLDAIKTDEKFQFMQSGCKTLDGRIWFPTAQGVAMINPTNLAVNPVAPKVHIQSIRANGRELNRSGEAIVPPGKGELEVHYAGLSYIAPQKIQYRYRLEGYDVDWVEAGSRRSAFYTNLKPGRYRFQVEACNGDGIWNSVGAVCAVQLQPHFYQTIWFTALVVVAGAGCLFGLVTLRMRHLKRKQAQLQQAHDELEAKVRERTAELAKTNVSLTNEIEERKRIELEVEQVHRQLLDASRQAGQAEVASNVLHNVGNVLNSVNVSANVISNRLANMRFASLTKATQLMTEKGDELPRFIAEDERGKHLPAFLTKLAKHLEAGRADVLNEVRELGVNIEHIKEIVTMQQAYGRIAGISETLRVSDLVESAFKMHAAAYHRHLIQIGREYDDVPTITVDKHRVLQILVNLFHNAKYACDESNLPDKKVTARIRKREQSVQIEVADNGIGIAPENLTRIFSHGFTTRKDGHGFGLHSAVLAAKELGGSLLAHSEGVGKGATFTLELPLEMPIEKAEG
jgi:ligand-binding sensor domain-containing protein/signal transduction histidine kinase